MDQSTQAILPHDSAHRQRRHRGMSARRPLVQPLVWPCLLVVLHELHEHIFHVATTHDQHVIQNDYRATKCPAGVRANVDAMSYGLARCSGTEQPCTGEGQPGYYVAG